MKYYVYKLGSLQRLFYHFLNSTYWRKKWLESYINEGLKFKNHVKTKDLTQLAVVFWQIMTTNILPQAGHVNEIWKFGLYVLWNIIAYKKINLSVIIPNHLFGCQN